MKKYIEQQHKVNTKKLLILSIMLLLFNSIKSWFALDIEVIISILLNLIGFFLNIYIIIKVIKTKNRNYFQVIILIMAILLNFIPLSDYKVYLDFYKTENLRMEVIQQYQNVNMFLIQLDEKYKDLSQNGVILNYDGQVFSFPIYTTTSIYEGNYIIYSQEKEEELVNYIGRIYSIKNLADNWYYIKC